MTPRIDVWRKWGLLLFLFGAAGLGLELLLLGHFAEPWQWTPLVLLGLGLVLGSLMTLRGSRTVVRAFQALMVAYLVGTGLGIFLHLKSNVEFELELRPTMAGGELILESLRGAMPALAPGALAQLGLLGLLITYKHPQLSDRGRPEHEPA